VQYDADVAPILNDVATSRLALDATAPAAVNCYAYMVWEE